MARGRDKVKTRTVASKAEAMANLREQADQLVFLACEFENLGDRQMAEKLNDLAQQVRKLGAPTR